MFDDPDQKEIKISRAEARAIIAGLSELDTKVEAATEEDERRVLNLRERFEEEFGFEEESGTDPDGETYTGPAWTMSNY